MNELQGELLSIFKIFHETCKKLNIRYFAFGGTALGGERHGGFIPWDDDMDFVMLRQDYDIFLERAPKLLPNYIHVQTPTLDKLSHFPFIKLRDKRTTQIELEICHAKFNQGCWIDIFPLDEVTNDIKVLKDYNYECHRMWKRITLRYKEKKVKSFKEFIDILKLLIKYPFWRQTVKKVNNFNLLHKTKSGYLTYCWDHRDRFLFPCNYFSDVKIMKFEGVEMMFSSKNKDYLTLHYGDWKLLPPVEKRVSVHNCYLDLNSPFKYKRNAHYEKNY